MTADDSARDAEIRALHREIENLSASLRESRHEHLVQTEKLAAVGELIAGIAHELNNPLAVMLGYVDLLIRELGPDTWPVRMEVDLIVQQIGRARKIIDNLLQVARPMHDLVLLEPAELGVLIQDCLALVLHQAQQTDVQIHTDLQATAPVRISRQDLQQVIINLIVNALHAVEDDHGLIEVRSRDWEEHGIVIRVGDSGPGVPPDLRDKIFRPFFTTKTAGKGTGLGLSVSTGLIRRYGGALTLESTSGQGTEFGIWVRAEPLFGEQDNWLAQTLVSSLEANAQRPPRAAAHPDHHPGDPHLSPRSCSCDERSPAWPRDRSRGQGA